MVRPLLFAFLVFAYGLNEPRRQAFVASSPHPFAFTVVVAAPRCPPCRPAFEICWLDQRLVKYSDNLCTPISFVWVLHSGSGAQYFFLFRRTERSKDPRFRANVCTNGKQRHMLIQHSSPAYTGLAFILLLVSHCDAFPPVPLPTLFRYSGEYGLSVMRYPRCGILRCDIYDAISAMPYLQCDIYYFVYDTMSTQMAAGSLRPRDSFHRSVVLGDAGAGAAGCRIAR